jgi:hypothetical protein
MLIQESYLLKNNLWLHATKITHKKKSIPQTRIQQEIKLFSKQITL